MSVRDKTVLIVDDSSVNVEILGEILDDLCEVAFALDGARALVLARTENPALILLDLFMPGMDGLEIYRKLKADEGTASIPVIFVTAADKDGALAEFQGTVETIAKPIDPAKVRARVKHYLA